MVFGIQLGHGVVREIVRYRVMVLMRYIVDIHIVHLLQHIYMTLMAILLNLELKVGQFFFPNI